MKNAVSGQLLNNAKPRCSRSLDSASRSSRSAISPRQQQASPFGLFEVQSYRCSDSASNRATASPAPLPYPNWERKGWEICD